MKFNTLSGENNMNEYRFDQYDSVYQLIDGSYHFAGKLNGRTEEEFIADMDVELYDIDYNDFI